MISFHFHAENQKVVRSFSVRFPAVICSLSSKCNPCESPEDSVITQLTFSELVFGQLPLCRDQGLQGKAVGDHRCRAVLLNEMLLSEIRENAADSLSRRADHLPDLFVSRRQLHFSVSSSRGT